jgi:REP-associated tyrosine transposase
MAIHSKSGVQRKCYNKFLHAPCAARFTRRRYNSVSAAALTRVLRKGRRLEQKELPAPSPAQGLQPIMTFPSVHDINHLYFVTASILGWKHLLCEAKYRQIVLDSLVWLQNEKRILLFAFVIMPSHLHFILKPEGKTIGEILQDFGSYTAHTILSELRKDQRDDLLKLFHEQRRDVRHNHSIWQDIQAKNIYSAEFLNQKLEYIHSNPISKGWELVEDRAEYQYASACFYDKGIPPIIPITDINEWLMV